MGPETRIRWAMAAATVLHVVGVVSMREAGAGLLEEKPRLAEPPGLVADLEVELVAPVSPSPSPRPPRPEAIAPPVQIAAHAVERVISPRPLAPRPREAEPPSAGPAEGDGVPDHPSIPGGDDETWSPLEPGPSDPGASGYGLSLADRVALAPAPAPAPTEAPKRAPLTTESVERGLRSAMRDKDQELGLGAPERQIVSRAVREPLRAVHAPSGTHVAYEVTIDASGLVGSVRRLRTSAGDETMWREADRAIRGSLLGQRLPLGVDAQRSGVRIVVDAAILHVLPSGSMDGEWVGSCSPTYQDGDVHGSRALFPSETFFSVGGSLYGDRPGGTCTTYEDPSGKRHIEVRATTTSHFENEPPPPGKPKPAKLLPWIKKDKPKP